MSLSKAIAEAHILGFPYAVQACWTVAHGSGDGIGRAVYAVINPMQWQVTDDPSIVYSTRKEGE